MIEGGVDKSPIAADSWRTMIALQEYGPAHGEPIVLIHGAGVAGWIFDPQWSGLPLLRFVVPDVPDHGASRDVPFESVEQTAKMLLDALSAHGIASFHVVGHSLGAKVALEMLRSDAASPARRIRSGVIASALLRPSWLTRSSRVACSTAVRFG